ncbi:MltR family transcriptional regulator [Paraburkholderia sp. C35]|uniref:MltR family transcriptional regulator n=1 Tax=Paraburkholderia sp. C35 TaxID=2126993 RepID=UPI000D693E10|nr:MltR family transcriptional regulator [Paraburkholderia sp. C35]
MSERDDILKLMYGENLPPPDQLLRHLQLSVDFLSFATTLKTESDRACALMAAAWLDDQLGLLLRENFLEDKKATELLFDATGPLSTFSGRIALARALGLIPKAVLNDLLTLKRIRNDFAHTAAPIDFSIEPIASRCHNLQCQIRDKHEPPRLKFVNCMMGIAGAIQSARVRATRPASPAEPDMSAHREGYPAFSEELERFRSKLTNGDNDVCDCNSDGSEHG